MRRTKEEAFQTKESLMDASLAVFLKKGYSKTSLDDIVNKLNLTRGAFYGHFKDKDDLFRKVMDREMTFISNLIVDSFLKAGDEKSQLLHLCEMVIHNFYTNTRFRTVIEITWFKVELDSTPYILKNKTDFNEFLIESLSDIFAQAEMKGRLISGLNSKDAALHIVAVITGIYRLYFVTPRFFKDLETSKRIVIAYVSSLFVDSTNS